MKRKRSRNRRRRPPPSRRRPPADGRSARTDSRSPSEAQAATPYNGVAQGLTPEGFPFLGAANAPVTLTDHSDFL